MPLVLRTLLSVLAFGLLATTPGRADDDPPHAGGPVRLNRLAKERSPYLRQHRTNPVDWYPWGDEAFARARQENRPVFLSVGYAACHWCHVMEHESFEDGATAALLNRAFVCVKVDREERPDVDALYMRAVQVLSGRGGWPMTVVLTPEGEPFFAGTYLPRENLQQLTLGIEKLWGEDQARLRRQAEMVADRVRDLSDGRELPAFEGTDDELLRIVDNALAAAFDGERGGYAGAPKFPPHTELLYLLVRAERDGREEGLEQVRRTLDAMADGGVHDHVGGGFHRYSTDADWLLPHFEKMLYDNALLVQAYARAHHVTGEERYGEVARRVLGWVERELKRPDGGYASSLDADTEGEEGLTYTWTLDELGAVWSEGELELATALFGLGAKGNFREESTGRPLGRNIVHLPRPLPVFAAERKVDAAALGAEVTSLLERLRVVRDRRPQPGLDDKVITAWNGLLVSAFAHAGRALEDADLLDRGRELADFLLTHCRREDGTLLRFPGGSGPEIPGFADDHVHLAEGLLDLADATGESKWAVAARDLGERLLEHFEDEHAGGFWSTSDAHHETLFARHKETFDGPIPSENGTAARLLLRLWARTGDVRFRKAADRTLGAWRPLLGMARAARGTVALYRALADRRALLSEVGEPAGDADAVAETDVLRVDAYLERDRLGPGSTTAFALRLTFAEGWHANATEPEADDLVPTRLDVGGDVPATLARLTWPPPVRRALGDGQPELPIYEGVTWVRGALRRAGGASDGEVSLELVLHVQPCSERECLAPRELRVALPAVYAQTDGEPRHAEVFGAAARR